MEALQTQADMEALLGVDVKTLQKWRRDGVGPPWLKLGQGIRYRPQDVEAWLQAQTRGSVPAGDQPQPTGEPQRPETALDRAKRRYRQKANAARTAPPRPPNPGTDR